MLIFRNLLYNIIQIGKTNVHFNGINVNGKVNSSARSKDFDYEKYHVCLISITFNVCRFFQTLGFLVKLRRKIGGINSRR